MSKLSKKMTKELNAQMGREFSASNQYLAMAIYLDDKSLTDLANFFYRQSEEERQHAMKFMHFIMDSDARPVVPEIPKPKGDFESVEEIAEMSLEMEREVTGCIHKIVDLAMDERDHSTNRFLQWFVEEQIEEEATFSKLLDVTRQSTNLLLIDQYVSRMEPEGGPDEGA
jgi:ferritin